MTKKVDKKVSEVMAAMVRKRWAKTTKAQRSDYMRKVANARWAQEKGKK